MISISASSPAYYCPSSYHHAALGKDPGFQLRSRSVCLGLSDGQRQTTRLKTYSIAIKATYVLKIRACLGLKIDCLGWSSNITFRIPLIRLFLSVSTSTSMRLDALSTCQYERRLQGH
jgi:hypothetical protein